jgi:hypothetical protein
MAIRWRHQATKGTFNGCECFVFEAYFACTQGCLWFGLILFDVDKKIF